MGDQPWQWFIEQPDQYEHHMFACERVLFLGQTPYQSVQIVDTFNFGKMLVLDGKVQSAEADEFIYHEALVHPAMMTHPDPRRILIVGGGEGASLREVLRYPSVEEVTMVDLDKEVVALARIHLPEWHQASFDHPKTRLVFDDGRKFLERTDALYDVIIIDITDILENGLSLSLYTREFYRLVQSRLSSSGLVAVQGLELSHSDFEGHSLIRSTLRSVYPIVRSYKTFIPSFWADWGFLIASDQLDPVQVDKSVLIDRISKRLPSCLGEIGDSLRFYDMEAHYAFFHIPKYLRVLLDKEQSIIEDNKPLQIGDAKLSQKPWRNFKARNKIKVANGA